MPELPEVETIKRELSRALVGRKIKSAEVLWPKSVAPLSAKEFEKQIAGQKIKSASRRAKMLIVDLAPLENTSRHVSTPQTHGLISKANSLTGFRDATALVFHLKMTGQLILGGKPTRYTRIIFNFSDSAKLYFNDLRKFGWARLVDDKQLKNLTENIGLEPLSKIFTHQTLADIFKNYPNRTIKQILLDQKLIAGIGNIYSDESCFLAKILPTKKAGTLKPAQIKILREKIIAVLKLAIQKKGTSARDYFRSTGQPGGFVPHLNVYGRAGLPCKVCGHLIKKIKHAGRGTHFCPHCQK